MEESCDEMKISFCYEDFFGGSDIFNQVSIIYDLRT